jgi:hypothetical protein
LSFRIFIGRKDAPSDGPSLVMRIQNYSKILQQKGIEGITLLPQLCQMDL